MALSPRRAVTVYYATAARMARETALEVRAREGDQRLKANSFPVSCVLCESARQRSRELDDPLREYYPQSKICEEVSDGRSEYALEDRAALPKSWANRSMPFFRR